ncbi:MAG: hypothetical protein ACREBV_07040 [Candidatus Zixiibacteriota bacterium]
MIRRLVLTALGLIFTFAVSGIAGDNGVLDNSVKKEFRFDVRESERTGTVEKNLTHEIDLWHDATLKKNGKRIRAHEKRIFEIIEADIQARDRVIHRYENEAGRSTAEVAGQPGPAIAAAPSDKLEMHDDIKDLRQAKQLVKAKQLLYDSIKRTDTFSNRYRLLGDYLEIVKRESRMNTIELAEDGRELKKSSIE